MFFPPIPETPEPHEGGVDVFLIALHDLTIRNAVPEAVHELLEARHALAVRHLAAVREAGSFVNVGKWHSINRPAPMRVRPMYLASCGLF